AGTRVDGAAVHTREVRDQLDRASLSCLLNTAEGNSKRQRQVRVRYFDDARGSAGECAACLDALVAKRVCIRERVEPGKVMLVRIGQMLTGLVARYEDASRVREPAAVYVAGPLRSNSDGCVPKAVRVRVRGRVR